MLPEPSRWAPEASTIRAQKSQVYFMGGQLFLQAALDVLGAHQPMDSSWWQ